jgi:hypothetical protein
MQPLSMHIETGKDENTKFAFSFNGFSVHFRLNAMLCRVQRSSGELMSHRKLGSRIKKPAFAHVMVQAQSITAH